MESDSSGGYISLSGAAIHVQQSGSQWIATLKDGSSEVYSPSGQLLQLIASSGQVTTLAYNAAGQLATVTGPFGHQLQFQYDGEGRIETVVEPDGTSSISYTYDTNDNLVSVTYPDHSARQYLYQNASFPNDLTGIIDESGTQFLTVTYDPSTGAVTSSQQAGGAQAVSISYGATTATVTDALGASNVYTFTNDPNYAPRVASFTRNGLTQSFTVPAGATDPQRRPTQITDANGNVTTFTYDSDHMTSKTEASGTANAQTTSYEYLAASSALPTLVTEALHSTAYTYYVGTNLVQTRTLKDLAAGTTRTWSYTYDSYGRALTETGPRTDVSSTTTYTYYSCTIGYQCGQLETVTDAAGHTTTFSTYNAFGQPLTITDPNGVVTTRTYDARQRLTSRTVDGETTSFAYYPTGLLQRVTLPDGSYLAYLYDGAHRLIETDDGVGNRDVFTLDAMGNRTAESVYDPSHALARTHTRVFNSLNEVSKEIGSAGTSAVTTTFGYDNNGNLTSVDAPLGRNTANAYDALNRVVQKTDPAGGIAKLGYDANDEVTSVTDPRNLTTTYAYDGFGDLLKRISPDTGTTVDTYDSGGNLATSTDARGATATYSYDALNRVTSISYALNGTTDETTHFTYDAGQNGIGRLTGVSDGSHSLSWTYDALGRVTGKTQRVGSITKSVGYTYANGDLTQLVTPSGQTIAFSYTNHQVTGIAVNGTALLSNVRYEPFGPASGWTWGNGASEARVYDEDGNLTGLQSAENFSYNYDAAFRVTGITDTTNPALSQSYGYDALDRLTNATSAAANASWTYDANGNRLSQAGTAPSTYSISATSNQISAISGALTRAYTYDAAGDTTSFGPGTSATYDGRGRLASISYNGAPESLTYDAFGKLVLAQGALGTEVLIYDEASHLLGEYDASGNLIQETVWMGNISVATLRPNGAGGIAVYYVHTDHLNTPRQVTRPSDNKIVWRWDSDPFGSAKPNQNPTGLGTFTYNLRFPGQILYFNGEREYDPTTGRYVESDPIGLNGGSFSTYAYVRSSPISHADPLGLLPGDCYLTENAAGENAINDINWQSIQSNTEYAGRIYQNQDGTYSYTAPDPGTATTSNPGPLTQNTVGTYHTHGAAMPGYSGETYSLADISLSISEGLYIQGYIAFLGTPSGVIKAFDPHSYIGDPQSPQFWNLPYPSPGQAVPCGCGKE